MRWRIHSTELSKACVAGNYGLTYAVFGALKDEYYKIKDLILKHMTFLVMVCVAVIGAAFSAYTMWRRSSANSSSV